MQALSIELEDEVVDALEAERELFGFESRQAYVRWIVEHRGSIEAGQGQGPDRGRKRDRLLAEHRERIARLEEQVATLSQGLEGDRADDEPRASDDSSDDEATDEEGRGRAADGDESEGDDRDRRPGETPVNREPVLEVHGSPRTVRQGPDSTTREEPAEADATAREQRRDDDGVSGPLANETSETESDREKPSGLSPERVARIREDPVHEDAGVLGSVETERLDELSRRAVATTRKRLNRDVQTGLEYTSSTRLAGDGVRPGEDITDLDGLSIPGRSAETIEKRRHAVGRALAYLRDEGQARRSDFVDALYAECPAEYDTSDGWWRCIKEGLKQVDAVNGGEGTRVWRYRG